MIVRVKGSATSGNYGHAGRPGKRGGSAPRSSGVIGGIIDKHDTVLSDVEFDANEAARKMLGDFTKYSDELGFGDEFRHWTGYSEDAAVWRKFQPIPEWMGEHPSYIPKGMSTDYFPRLSLSNYYDTEGMAGTREIMGAFKSALNGEFGEKHKSAADLVVSMSQEVFRRKFGDKHTFFRSQSANAGKILSPTNGVSVSETAGMSQIAAQFFRKGEEISTNAVQIKADDIIFGFRTIPSPFPEREWVVGKLEYVDS